MKKLLAAAAAVSLLAIAAPASAAVYGSIGYSNLSIDEINLGAGTARVGYQSDTWWGVEGEVSFGVNEDGFCTGAAPTPCASRTDVDLVTDFAIYGVARWRASDMFSVFARLGHGVTRLEVENTVTGPPLVVTGARDESTATAWGLGAEVHFTENDSARLDWTTRDTNDDFGEDAEVWSISYVRQFR